MSIVDIGTEDDLNRRGGEEKLNTPRSSPFSAVIELAYVVDFKTTSVTFKKDRKKMLEYYAIMTNSVNNKYALTEDPMVRCRMISLLIIEVIKYKVYTSCLNMHELLLLLICYSFERMKNSSRF